MYSNIQYSRTLIRISHEETLNGQKEKFGGDVRL